jgi:predicted MFS family arabinose efflux permease
VFAVAVRGILRAPEVEARSAAAARWPVRSIGVAMLSYFVYGAGYISYMTFVVALIGSRGASNAEIGWFWVTLGLASIATTFFWGRAIARLGGRWGTATILGITTIGAIIPVLTDSIWAAFASAIIFGGSFLNVVTGVTSVARDVLEPRHWTAAIGALTVAFAAGQCIGPILTGAIADSHNGISVGLAVSAGLLGIAALTALAQRVPETPTIE